MGTETSEGTVVLGGQSACDVHVPHTYKQGPGVQEGSEDVCRLLAQLAGQLEG